MDGQPGDTQIVTKWPTVVMRCALVENLQEMKAEVYRLASLSSGVKKSNYGGWQSDIDLHENAAFAPLRGFLDRVCVQVFKVKGARLHQMWACINKKHDQNLIHSHTNKYDLSGVYYLNVPRDSGEIVFRDPRPGANNAPNRLFKDDGDSQHFMPSDGLVIMFPSYLEHFVLPNESDGDRISMSFNLTLER